MSVSGLQKSKVSMSNSNDPADPLADLFGFETAQKRPQEEQNQNISAHVELGFKPWRVFVNNIDSYHGRRIVEFLSEQQYVNSLRGTEDGLHVAEVADEEEGESEKENFQDDSVENEAVEKLSPKILEPSRKLEIIGTSKNPEHKIPEDVRLIVRKEEHDKDFVKEMINCGYVIYDITEDDSEIEEALWVLQGNK